MKKFIHYGVVFVEVLLLISLSRGLYETLSSRERIDNLQTRKEQLLDQEANLQQELLYVESDYYIESVARNKLHLTKSGETLVLVDPAAIPEILGLQEIQEVDDRENWQKWMEILFGSE